MQEFDHIIIGTGQATGTLLGKLVPTGDRIAVLEGTKVGGSCVNYGCTPTKTLVASAKAIHKARQGETYGFETGPLKVNYSRIRERMNSIRNGSREGLASWLDSTDNIKFIREWGSFEDKKVIRAGNELIKGEKIYINTGAKPTAPPIKGLDKIPWLDSAGLLDLEEMPKHLIIIGGGYIGMEFSQIYRRFGAKVTVIQRGDQVMPNEDKDVADEIQSFLQDEGIKILCNSSATAVSKEDEKIKLTVESNDNTDTITGSHLLIAAGRKPNTEHLALQNAGININDGGFVEVDDYCQTNVEDVYAVGDVNGQGAFTHTSVNDAEIVLDQIFHGGRRRLSERVPIYSLFTDPPMGKVGLSEKEALAKGHRVLRSKLPMSKINRAKEMAETNGFAKLMVDADTDLIIGALVLGPGGDEIINMFAAIMHSNIPCHSYRRVVLLHPTVSELMPFLLDSLEEVKPEDK
jgi:pyruvate/2-oxoglutarate dehydrogenase complex dihydrolipoamide dehydrogenase (E3) component